MAESMQGLHRTCRCAEVTTEMVGKEVTLMGWVAKARNKEVLYLWIFVTVPGSCS